MRGRPAGEVAVEAESDIVLARRHVREASVELGFGVTDVTRIVTAVSELTRNMVQYAGSGRLSWRTLEAGGRTGLELLFEDSGPGIPDIDRVLEAGYSTGKGLGMGLPGARRLFDEMEVESEVGRGTRVVARKWLRQ